MAVHYSTDKIQIRHRESDCVMQYRYHTETHCPAFNRNRPNPPLCYRRRKLHFTHKTHTVQAVIKLTVKRKGMGMCRCKREKKNLLWLSCGRYTVDTESVTKK